MERSQTSKGQIARQRILREAETLLAARGFHGTSMRDVAESAGIALANVVYHFPRKEQLHAAVLDGIAAVLSERMRRSPSDPIRELVRWSASHPRHVRLLVRELLDNPARVSKASRLPLAPVLLLLADAVRAKTPEHPDPELAVLHLIGALSYVVIARPTVRRILGTKRDDEMMDGYEDKAVAFAEQALAPPAPARSSCLVGAAFARQARATTRRSDRQPKATP